MLDRRDFLKLASVSPFVGAAPWLASCSGSDDAGIIAEPGGEPRPNIVLFWMDDMNDWVEILDRDGMDTVVHTPNLRRLTERGVNATSAYCSVSKCMGSRISAHYSISPSQARVFRLTPTDFDNAKRVMSSGLSIHEVLDAAGYDTYVYGKVFHDNERGSIRPTDADFATYERPPVENAPSDPTGQVHWGSLEEAGWTEADLVSTKAIDAAVAALAADRSAPFFLSCGTFLPHLPWLVPQRFLDQYPIDDVSVPETLVNDLEDVPPAGRSMSRAWGGRYFQWFRDSPDAWKQAVRHYCAAITYADFQLGRVLDVLEASPHAANTIVVATSDHGLGLGEKNHWGKDAVWDEFIRVPFVAAGPAIAAGASIDDPISLLDLAPTLCDLAGVASPAEWHGHTIGGALRDPAANDGSHRRPVLSFAGDRITNTVARSCRIGHRHVIWYEDDQFEFYDLQLDPNEWDNRFSRLDAAELTVFEEAIAAIRADEAR